MPPKGVLASEISGVIAPATKAVVRSIPCRDQKCRQVVLSTDAVCYHTSARLCAHDDLLDRRVVRWNKKEHSSQDDASPYTRHGDYSFKGGDSRSSLYTIPATGLYSIIRSRQSFCIHTAWWQRPLQRQGEQATRMCRTSEELHHGEVDRPCASIQIIC